VPRQRRWMECAELSSAAERGTNLVGPTNPGVLAMKPLAHLAILSSRYRGGHYCCLKIPPERTGCGAVEVLGAFTMATPFPSPTIVVP